MIVDRLENWRQLGDNPAWKVAFDYLLQLRPDADEGEFPLQGDEIFARVMSYPTVSEDAAKFEAHLEYIDIQMPLIGGEGIGWHPLPGLEIKIPYDLKNDVAFYHPPEAIPARADLAPGMFALLYPNDAHMPQLRTSASESVKKTVVKIRASLVMPD